MHSVLHPWCFQASGDNIGEMAWLVASSAPEDTIVNHTLIQRLLFLHFDRLSFLLQETMAKAPCNGEDHRLTLLVILWEVYI